MPFDDQAPEPNKPSEPNPHEEGISVGREISNSIMNVAGLMIENGDACPHCFLAEVTSALFATILANEPEGDTSFSDSVIAEAHRINNETKKENSHGLH